MRLHDQIRPRCWQFRGLPTGWPGAVVHAAPDTALQNDQICASQRAKPGGGDLRQNGGYASSHDAESTAVSDQQTAEGVVALPGSTAAGARDGQTAVARQEAGGDYAQFAQTRPDSASAS